MKNAILILLLIGCTHYEENAKTQNDQTQTCTPPQRCTQQDYDNGTCCECQGGCCPNSPIVIDLAGDGFQLSSPEDGVRFELKPGFIGQWAWTSSGDAWLALPGEDGIVHDGTELFGNETPQDGDGPKNGFNALSRYDRVAFGGNEDGKIGHEDIVFDKLRLWTDVSPRDGRSQPEELLTLSSVGISSFAFPATLAEHVDANGNEFRLKATIVADAPVDTTVSDVWLRQIPVTDDPVACQTEVKCTAWAYIPIGNPFEMRCASNPGGHGVPVYTLHGPPGPTSYQAELFSKPVALTVQTQAEATAELKREMTEDARSIINSQLLNLGIAGCGPAPYPVPDTYLTPTQPAAFDEYHATCTTRQVCGGCFR